MATFTTTYAGKDARGLIGESIATVASFAQDGFVIDTEAVGKAVFRFVDLAAAAWVDDDGEYEDQDNLKFADKTLPLLFKKINESIKKKDIKLDWMGLKAGKGATGELSVEDQSKIRETVVSVIAKATDSLIWSNIITAADADTKVLDAPLNVITAANVVAELDKVVAKYSELTSNVGEAVLYMNPKIRAMYNTALGGQGTNDSRGFKATDLGGYRIVSSIAIPLAKIVMTPKENMGFSIDLLTDLGEVKFLDQSTGVGGNKINIVANAAFNGAYVRAEEFVMGTSS